MDACTFCLKAAAVRARSSRTEIVLLLNEGVPHVMVGAPRTSGGDRPPDAYKDADRSAAMSLALLQLPSATSYTTNATSSAMAVEVRVVVAVDVSDLVAEVERVVLGDDVAVLECVTEGVVVRVGVAVVVRDALSDVVPVVDRDEVTELVSVDVAVVEGEVSSHAWKPPPCMVLMIPFSLDAVCAQSRFPPL